MPSHPPPTYRRTLISGGPWAAAHRLAAEPLASRPPRAEFAFPIGQSEAVVRAADEDGRIDLNAAGEPLLAALFRTAGMEERSAGALARALVDRRAVEAHRAGLRAVGELAALPGGTLALAEAVRGAATIHTGRARPVAEAAPGMAAAALALEARAMPPLPSRSGGLRTPSLAQGEAGRRMIWRIEATGRSGAVEAHLAAVLQIAPGDGMPGRVLEWQPAAR